MGVTLDGFLTLSYTSTQEGIVLIILKSCALGLSRIKFVLGEYSTI
ncbi:MAG: hypothetical protein IJU54_00385 [Alphaproteobacteria bacterium]|nr:hypothetical protein [Alphaproteobacteria bacterium]